MNTLLSKRLDEILKQYVSAPPAFSKEVVQWVDDLQRETSAADHENLREDIRDLKDDVSQIKTQQTFLANDVALLRTDFKDLKDDVSQIRDQLTDFKLNTAERFASLEKSMLLIRSEMQEQLHLLKLSTSERFNSLDKLNIRLSVQMWCIIFLLGVLVFPTIQKFLQH